MTVILTSGGNATISTLAEFNDVITQAAFLAADSGTYEIHLAAGSTIDLRGGDGLLAFNLQGGVQVIVKGNGATLDGHTTTHGLIVYGGSVTFEDLTVANTTAQGGDGIGSAGAGAGLGGGLFVANDSGVPGNVTLSNVDFVNTKAAGGLTAFVRLGDFDSTGGGGGLFGGTGGYPVDFDPNLANGNINDHGLHGAGGGGGFGGHGGSFTGAGEAGLVPNAPGGSAGGSGTAAGGANGGGGGAGTTGTQFGTPGGGGGIGANPPGTNSGNPNNGKDGGFGGGGGGSSGFPLSFGGDGGFGGGGGGGSRLYGGHGGFGGGGGAGASGGNSGGFGGGDATDAVGGGGLAAGGVIFVQGGARVVFAGSADLAAGTLQTGDVVGVGVGPVNNGQQFANGIYLEGFSASLTFNTEDPTTHAATSQTVSGVIGDDYGSAQAAAYDYSRATLTPGHGGLDKSGAGTLTLTAINTYVGGTNVNAGTLIVDGSIAGSAVDVQSGATLGGHGTTGAVVIRAGGTLAPGNSPGTIHTGDLTFTSGAHFAVQIAGTTAGTGYDQVVVNGAVSLGGASLDLTFLNGFESQIGNSYLLIDNDGIDAVTGQFAQGAYFASGGHVFAVNYSGGDGNDVALICTTTADLSVTTTVSNATPNVGDQITFTITLSNQGPDDATGVQVADLLPAGLTFVSSTSSQGTYTSSTGLWEVGAVSSGGAPTLEITATVVSATSQTNTGTITHADQFDPNTANDSASATETPQQADLALTTTVSDATPNVGDVITFTVTLSNQGPDDATGVQVADLLPAGVSYVSANPSQGSYDSSTGLWDVGTVSSGGGPTLEITATVVSATSQTNTGTITHADQFDPNTANDSASATETPQQADLALTNTVSDATPNVGDVITFTVTLSNQGPDDATGVQVADLLPAGVNFVSANPSQGSYDSSTGLWDVGTVSSGGAPTLEITATVVSATSQTNTGTITHADQFDPNTSNDSASATETPQQADLALTTTVSDATPNVGDVITFTVTLSNQGPDDATGVQVADLLPAGGNFVSANPSQGSYDSSTGLWDVGTVSSGGGPTLEITATVVSATSQTNTGTITHADQFDPNTANDSASATETPQQADLALTNTVSDAAPNVGDVITFTVTLSNQGPDDATGVQVADLLPAGVSFVSANPSQGTYTSGTGLWNVGTVGSGGAPTLEITATVVSATSQTNTGTITHADQFDPNTSNDSASAAVNAPTVDLDAGGAGADFTTTYMENAAPIPITAVDLVIAGPDTANLDTATIVLTNAKAADSLSFAGALPGGIGSTIDTSVPGQITIHLANSASVADYHTAISLVQFSNSSDAPNTTDRDITVMVSKNGTDSNIAHAAVHVTADNDAPVNTITAQIGTENTDTPVTGLSVSDVDIGSGLITVTLTVQHGTIHVADDVLGGLDSADIFDNDTSSVTLICDPAFVNATLASGITYRPDSNFAGTDTLTMLSDDGANDGTAADGAKTDSDTVDIVVAAVNDAPVNTVPAGPLTTPGNTNLVISGLSVSDADATALTTILHVAHGTLKVATGNAAVAGNGTATVTLTGTAAEINATFQAATHLTYHGTPGYAGADSLTVTTSDGGGTGTGGTRTDVDAVSITVSAAAASHAPNDFNGDGKSDIVWRNDAGVTAIWDMNDTAILHGHSLGLVPTNWHIEGTGDFNGDGMSDLLWRNDAGVTAIWDMNDGAILHGHSLGLVPLNWHIEGTGDFNGDGMSDIVWRNDDGVVAIWDMDDGTILQGHSLGAVPLNWNIAGIGDFNGDGKSDFLWRNDAGLVAIWDMNDGAIVGGGAVASVPSNWQIAGTGDFNGDHKSDILWRNDAGLVAVWDMNDTTIIGGGAVASAPANWHIADTGDYNGDGNSDILWRNDAGLAAIWDLNDTTIIGGGAVAAVPTNWHIIV